MLVVAIGVVVRPATWTSGSCHDRYFLVVLLFAIDMQETWFWCGAYLSVRFVRAVPWCFLDFWEGLRMYLRGK